MENKKPKNSLYSKRSSDSLTVIIRSTNLSEDMSTLSSNDDEIALFVYPFNDSILNSKPYFFNYFVLNKNKMSDTTYFNGIKKLLDTDLIVFLLEIDSDKKIEEIEPLIRENYLTLLKTYSTKNYQEIEKQIGDDDLLGIKMISHFKRGIEIIFSDIYRMDRYNYQITLN